MAYLKTKDLHCCLFLSPSSNLTNESFHWDSMIIKASDRKPLVHNMIGVCLPQFPKGQLSHCNTTMVNNRDFGSIISLTWKHWPFIPGKNRGLGLFLSKWSNTLLFSVKKLFSVDSVSINIRLAERNVSLSRFPLPTEIDWQDLSRCIKDYYGISLSNFNTARPTGRLNRFF